MPSEASTTVVLASLLVLLISLTACTSTQPSAASSSSASATPAYYGSALQFDVLDNQEVAQGDVDYRFRAQYSGAVTSFLWYDVYKRGGSSPGCTGSACECDGYGCGTGGQIEACIYSDDGSARHLPTDPLTQSATGKQAAPLGCASLSNVRAGSMLRMDTFDSPPVLTQGVLYHLHWHNSDPDPASNFISVDGDCVWHPTTPRQPTVPDLDQAVLSIYNNGSAIVANVVATDTPIFQLNYATGAAQGQGYIATWSGAPQAISALAQVRELFTLSGSGRTVTGAAVRVNRVSGSSPLTVTLATASGQLLAQGQIAATAFPLGQALSSNTTASQYVTPTWGSVSWTQPVSLSAGQSYQLVLSAPADTLYQDYGIQKGTGYDFTGASFFADGLGQFSADGGLTWSGFTQPDGTVTGSTDRINADIQFYLTVE